MKSALQRCEIRLWIGLTLELLVAVEVCARSSLRLCEAESGSLAAQAMVSLGLGAGRLEACSMVVDPTVGGLAGVTGGGRHARPSARAGFRCLRSSSFCRLRRSRVAAPGSTCSISPASKLMSSTRKGAAMVGARPAPGQRSEWIGEEP